MSDTATLEIAATLTPEQQASVVAALEYIHAVYKAPGTIKTVDFTKAKLSITHYNGGNNLHTTRIFKLRPGRRHPGTFVVYFAGKERVCCYPEGVSPSAVKSPESTSESDQPAKPKFRMSVAAEKAVAATS
jgi:hypothetical protein